MDAGEYQTMDQKIGRRVMEIRILRGLTRMEVVQQSQIPITIKQLEQSENGDWCLDASQLWELSRILKVPAIKFFQPLTETLSPLIVWLNIYLFFLY